MPLAAVVLTAIMASGAHADVTIGGSSDVVASAYATYPGAGVQNPEPVSQTGSSPSVSKQATAGGAAADSSASATYQVVGTKIRFTGLASSTATMIRLNPSDDLLGSIAHASSEADFEGGINNMTSPEVLHVAGSMAGPPNGIGNLPLCCNLN